MLDSIHFLNDSGEVIVEMFFQQRISRSRLESYWNTFIQSVASSEVPPPIVLHQDVVFAQMQKNHLYVVGTTLEEGSALVLLEELNLIVRLLTAYLLELSETTLRENFSLVCQVLQEIMDFGYPLTTELFALEELVARPSLESKVRSLIESTPVAGGRAGAPTSMGVGARQVLGSSSQVPWRDAATRHATNEILFDVVEYLDYVTDADGRLSRALVRGEVQVNCKLSGMPDIVVHLDRMDVVDDIAFHRCVRQQRYDTDRSVSFIPPDGKFTLLQYTVKPTLEFPSPSFYVTPQIVSSETGGRFNCMVGLRGGPYFSGSASSRVDMAGVAQQVRVKLLLPPHTTSVNVTNCTSGTASFDRKKSILTWVIGSVGSNSPSLGGDFVLDAAARAEAASPPNQENSSKSSVPSATRSKGAEAGAGSKSLLGSSCALVDFEIPNQNISGLGVQSVQVLNDVGKSYKGVKYITKAGAYVVRTS